MRRRFVSLLLVVPAIAPVAACRPRPAVDRAYGGSVVRGRFVDPEAYAAFLRGALAHAAGDDRAALAEYGEASRLDPESPEVWTRIGEVLCRANARDAAAQDDFTRALQLDPQYAPAWMARARCAAANGDVAAARAAAERAVALDPSADGANVLVLRAAAAAGVADPAAPTTRQRLVALTLTAREPLVAWDALASWAQAHGDVPLWSRALRETVRIAPSRRDAVARAGEELAGLGAVAEARAVAAAAVEADEGPFDGERRPLAARLALDDAIARGDPGALRRRLTRARLPLDEAAGRALLGGQRAMAREVAELAARGDPTARGARLVLAAANADSLLPAAAEGRADDAPVSGAALVAFAQALAHTTSPEQARTVLAPVPHGALVAGDDRVERPAVELASLGALPAAILPPEGAVELAAIRGEQPPEPLPALDARHEYLALSLVHPDSPRARELAERLATVRLTDVAVAAASCLVRLARGAPPPEAGAARALLALDPADPLLAAIALRLAVKVGDADAARRARAALAAVGGQSRPAVE